MNLLVPFKPHRFGAGNFLSYDNNFQIGRPVLRCCVWLDLPNDRLLASYNDGGTRGQFSPRIGDGPDAPGQHNRAVLL